MTGSVFAELQWRGLVSLTTGEDEVQNLLSSGPQTVYCGFDPTAASLHFGNLVQLMVLRHLQRAGHRVIALVGGSTGLIGDPSPKAERVLKTREQTAQWVTSIEQQVRPFLCFDGDNPALMVNNLDWFGQLSALDFLRDIGKHFRVNHMVKKDAVAARLNSEQGISYTEFSYQILQGHDYLHLFQQYGCRLQVGGQDQWGNQTAGTDLIHKVTGESAHVLCTPLLTDAQGNKFGKSEGNAVWLNPTMTSPYKFYQYFLNVEDSQVVKLLKVFSDRGQPEIEELARITAETPHLRTAQKTLAADITTLVHGPAACAAVQEASAALFGQGDLRSLDVQTLLDATAEVPGGTGEPGMSIVDALVASGICESRNAARRTVGDGAASVNLVKVHDPDYVLSSEDFLHGKVAVLKRGKKSMAALRSPE